MSKAFTKENDDAEIVIINTCGFIDNAKQESINTILEYAELKKQNSIEKLYVTGCLSERYKQNLEEEIPEVDAYFGTMELPSLLKKLGADYKHELIGERLLITPQHYAYLKISEGCNRTCAFCAIPLMRGKHISKPIEEIIQYVQSKPRVWLTTREGIADYMLKNYPDQDLSKFYPEAVASDKWWGLAVGLGGQEAIDAAQFHRKR